MTWPSLTLPTGNRFSTLKLTPRGSSRPAAPGAVGGAAALIGPRWIVGCSPSLMPGDRQLRHDLVEAEAERQRADDVARDVEQVEVDLRLRTPRQARIGRVAGAAVGRHADLGGRVRPRRRLGRGVVLAEQPLRGRARLEEEVAELGRAAAGGDALRQAHAHALQRAVVRAVDALVLGLRAVERDGRRQRVAGRVDRRDVGEVDLLRGLVASCRRPAGRAARGRTWSRSGPVIVMSEPITACRVGRVAPDAGDEDRARGRRARVTRGLLDPEARVGLEDVVEVRAVEVVDAGDDAADLDVARPDAQRVGGAPSVWMSVIFVKPLRVLRAARRRVPVVLALEVGVVVVGVLRAVCPCGRRRCCRWPSGTRARRSGACPRGTGSPAPVSNSLPTASITEVAAALERSCSAAVIRDAGRVGLVAAGLAAQAVREPVDRAGGQFRAGRDRGARALRGAGSRSCPTAASRRSRPARRTCS